MPYEMCVMTPAAELDASIETAKRLGWNGLCLIADKKEIKQLKDQLKKTKVKGINVSVGLLIEPKSKNELKRQASVNRKNYGIIAVRSQSPEMSRAAVETKGVDMLLGWESAGQLAHERVMDYVMIKLAAENGVAIAFSMQPLLAAYDRARAVIMSKYIKAARFVRKYNTSFILTSSAISAWDMRSPSELTSFGKVLGFNGKDIKQAISDNLLAKNRKRLSGKWVMPGVEVE